MTGVLEGVVIGGAAWTALEQYRDGNEKKKNQKRLLSELFARLFGSDFDSVAPDRTTHLRCLKSGSDSDVSAAYHFLTHFQEKRKKTYDRTSWYSWSCHKALFQDLFQQEEQRGDNLTMVVEYLKQWLANLPKQNETKSFASDERQVADVRLHLEFALQILMRPKLFRNGKENNFGIAISHFAEHVEKFYSRVNTTELNTGHVLEGILATGKNLLQQSLPVLLFCCCVVVGDDSQLPCFDSTTLLEAFERDCSAGGSSSASVAVAAGGSSSSAKTIRQTAPVGGGNGDVRGDHHFRAAKTYNILPSNRSAPPQNPPDENAAGVDARDDPPREKNKPAKHRGRRRNALAWETHAGKLVYLLLKTKHFRSLMETADGLPNPSSSENLENDLQGVGVSGSGFPRPQVEGGGGAIIVGANAGVVLSPLHNRRASVSGPAAADTATSVTDETTPRRDAELSRDIKNGDEEYPCYLDENDIDGDYLPGYNFEPTSMDRIRAERLRRDEEQANAQGHQGSTSGGGTNYQLMQTIAGTSRAVSQADDDQEQSPEVRFFKRRPDRQKFESENFEDFLDFVHRKWEVHLDFDDSGLLPRFRSFEFDQTGGAAVSGAGGLTSGESAEKTRKSFLECVKRIDNFAYFLSVLQIYSRLSLLGGDPMICCLTASIQHLLHETEIVLTDLYRLAENLSKQGKKTLKQLSKEPESLKEADLRWMHNLQFVDLEGFKINHKKLYLSFTELRSLSTTERVPWLKQSIEANLHAFENFQQRCAIAGGGASFLGGAAANSVLGIAAGVSNALPLQLQGPLKEGYVKTRVTEFEERGTAANSLSPAATIARGRSRDGGAVNKPEATSTRYAVVLERIVRLGAVDILPLNPTTTSAASSAFSEKTTTTTSAVAGGKPAEAFSPASRSQMKMNDASTQTLSWAEAIRENFAVDALRENLALLTTTTDPALNEEDADSNYAEGGIINSNGGIDFSSKRSTTKARVSLQTLSSVAESTLTENEVAFFEAIWNLLSTGEESIHEPERFDELVGRTNVSRRYLQAVSDILFATEFYTLSEGFGGGSAGKVISRGQFVVGLRLLAHCQELEAKEEAGEEFFAVVPFLSGGSLVDFAKTPPAKGVVRIEGVEWNGDTKRLKIRRPI
eukprot:g17523.t1